MLKGEVEARVKAFREALRDGSGEKIGSLIDEILDVEFTRSVSGEFRGFELVFCLGVLMFICRIVLVSPRLLLRGFGVVIRQRFLWGLWGLMFCGIRWKSWRIA